MTAPSPRAEALAAAFLDTGAWARVALVRRGAEVLGVPRESPWLRRVVAATLRAFVTPPTARFRELALVVERQLEAGQDGEPWGARVVGTYPVPTLALERQRWPVPALATAGELAAWLDLAPRDLAWFADPRALERRPGAPSALRHYRYAWVAKASGGTRLLEMPKPRTKALLRRVLHGVLDHVPPHDAAHGFRPGRSARSHAALHVGRAMVLRLDLADFFLSVSAARVRAVFAALGYPSEVAWLLTALVTNVAPVVPQTFAPGTPAATLRAARRAESLARTRHLPQGAPTSPALANLVAYGLDVRLKAVADAASARYSRYADDLVFSGDAPFARGATRFAALVAAIVRDEGFVVRPAKTRFLRRGVRQSVTGVIVNDRPTLGRGELERLEAILYNCARHGPSSQNRDGVGDFRAHLTGRVAHASSLDWPGTAWHRELLGRIVWA